MTTNSFLANVRISATRLVIAAGGLILLIPCASYSQNAPTFVGPGIAGQIHASAFDPSDTNSIYVGGDNAGVFRTTDGGATWEIWNDGLQNDDLSLSFYIDDLLVIEEVGTIEPSNTGVYAATHGGIYRRDVNGSSWILETDYKTDSQFEYTGGFLGPNSSGAVPFSSIVYDEVSGFLYAGAGHSRFTEVGNWRLFYPEAGTGTKYALWRKNLAVIGSSWESVSGTEINPKMVTDLAVIYHKIGRAHV